MTRMHPDTRKYHADFSLAERKICTLLAKEIDAYLPGAENKIWHAHPVWFLDGNPIVGYSRLKGCVRLLFWSGRSFATRGLTGKSKLQEHRDAKGSPGAPEVAGCHRGGRKGPVAAATFRYTRGVDPSVPLIRRFPRGI